jgi:arginine N-succinyltransferase
MLMIRPLGKADLPGLMNLASMAKAGLTTLPHDRDILAQRLEESEKSFSQAPSSPKGETYLFGLEDGSDQDLIGVCGIVSKIGGFQPHWTYELKEELYHSKALGSLKHVPYLSLKMNHDGPTEIGTLFLSPKCRGGDGGRLLSLSRFLFLSAFPNGFEDDVIAEMRGQVSDAGHSVFWEAVGRHFFQVDFAKADLMAMKDKRFIEELMPRHPIYISLLPKAAQMVIGEVHENTLPARRLLEQEGFRFKGEVDIFEAGPVLSCRRRDIRVVQHSRTLNAKRSTSKKEFKGTGVRHMVAKVSSAGDFRVVAAEMELNGEQVSLTSEVFARLGLEEGEPVLVSPIRSSLKR